MVKAAVEEAKKATALSKKLRKGRHGKVVKVRTKARFFKPKTLRLKRKPAYPRALPAEDLKLRKYDILKAPVASDSAMTLLETQNTLTWTVDIRSTKPEIKKAMKERFSIEVAKVNTLIRPNGTKKAYIRLTKDHDALDTAHKIGIV